MSDLQQVSQPNSQTMPITASPAAQEDYSLLEEFLEPHVLLELASPIGLNLAGGHDLAIGVGSSTGLHSSIGRVQRESNQSTQTPFSSQGLGNIVRVPPGANQTQSWTGNWMDMETDWEALTSNWPFGEYVPASQSQHQQQRPKFAQHVLADDIQPEGPMIVQSHSQRPPAYPRIYQRPRYSPLSPALIRRSFRNPLAQHHEPMQNHNVHRGHRRRLSHSFDDTVYPDPERRASENCLEGRPRKTRRLI